MGISPGTVFGIALSIYFVAAVLPGAFDSVFSANTTAWDTGTVAIWGLLPLAVIGLVIFKYAPRAD